MTTGDEIPALQRSKSAVIDIGSNSVRLVIYEGPRRSPFPICNEKSLCGLGRDMADDGALNPAAVDMALSTLARFRRLLDEHGNPPVQTIATAAVREAKDGAAFVARVRALGLDVEVIGGGEEASLAAFGVASFEPWATGLAGDLGGGSLELVAMENGSPFDAASLSIGPLRLMQHTKGDLKAASKEISRALAGVDWLKSRNYGTFYAVGGAWRSIARLHMQLKNHPLPVLHHYEMTGRQAIETCELVARQSRSSLETTPGISSRRVDTIPYAALVLSSLVEEAKIGKISISAGGLREGALYRALPPEIRSYDPLLAGASYFASRMAPADESGAAYAALCDTLFTDETPAERRIRVATCLLADIGAYFHPDLRGEHAFDTALRAPFYGVTHPERASIALALYCRHESAKSIDAAQPVLGLMSDAERKRATEIGLALRFAASVAPKAPHAIRRCSLKSAPPKLIFTAPRDMATLIDETPRKRFEALAAALGLEPVIVFQD